MQPATIFVLLVLALLIFGLVRDHMRPGMILFSGAVAFMAVGILQPREMLEGFSNKGMITVAMLFLVSEGVRRSGLLEDLLRRLLPSKRGGGEPTAGPLTAVHCQYIGLSEQYACGGDFCPYGKALGRVGKDGAHQIAHTAFLRHHSGRYVYAYRHVNQPGGAWHGA